jgi:hypothetical protein
MQTQRHNGLLIRIAAPRVESCSIEYDRRKWHRSDLVDADQTLGLKVVEN